MFSLVSTKFLAMRNNSLYSVLTEKYTSRKLSDCIGSNPDCPKGDWDFMTVEVSSRNKTEKPFRFQGCIIVFHNKLTIARLLSLLQNLNERRNKIHKERSVLYDGVIKNVVVLNSQYFWKWTNANPIKFFGQAATASKL